MYSPADCPICQRTAGLDWLHPTTRASIACEAFGTFEITKDYYDWWIAERGRHAGKLKPEDEELLPYLSAASDLREKLRERILAPIRGARQF